MTRTVTCICRSTPGCGRPGVGGACTRSGCGTSSRRSTGSATPRWSPTPSSGQRWPSTGSPWTPRPARSSELAPYVGRVQRSGRADRAQHRPLRGRRGGPSIPARSPAPRLRQAWDRRAWAQARPDKVVPTDGAELVARWNDELRELGYRDPAGAGRDCEGTRLGGLDRDAAVDLVLTRLGAKRSAWNAADVRGQVEVLPRRRPAWSPTPAVRLELAEDLTARAVAGCVPLLARADVPEHVRALTSPHVLEVEDRPDRSGLGRRGEQPDPPGPDAAAGDWCGSTRPRPRVVGALAGDGQLVVVEGAAGAGKTTTLRRDPATARRTGSPDDGGDPDVEGGRGRRRRDRTPTAHSAAWLVHQHGWRWDDDGHWTRQPAPDPRPDALLRPR